MIGKIEIKSMIERYEWLLFGGLLLLALGIHIYSTFGGLIWTSDSFHYWAASVSWHESATLEGADGSKYLFWPPLFPIILSFFNEAVYHGFHTLCFLSSLLFIYLFLKKTSFSRDQSLLTLFIFILSVFPYLISSFLWSESIFVLLMYAGLNFYAKWEESDSFYDLVSWIIILAAMCLQRNAGVFIMVGLSFYALLQFISITNFTKLSINALGILLTILPNALWNFNTIVKSSNQVAQENISFFNGIFLNLKNISVRLFHFFLPDNSLGIIDTIAAISVIILVVFLIFKFYNQFSLVLFLSYLLMFSFVPLIEPESIDRFITPVIPLFIFLLVRLFSKSLSIKSFYFKVFLILTMLFFISYNASRTINNVKMWHNRSITNPKGSKIFF
jgi:hypothetical protein